MIQSQYQTFILCAGSGTRLSPLTQRIPKPLIPCGRKTLLDTILEHFPPDSSRVILNTHHLHHQMVKKLESLKIQRGYSSLYITHEPVLLDSGGCMGFAQPLLQKSEYFLVHNGDILHTLPLISEIEKLNPEPNTIYLWASQKKGIQNLETDENQYLVQVLPRDPLPKPQSNHFAFCGIALYPKNFLKYCPTYPISIKPLWAKFMQEGGKIKVIPHSYTWFDLGTPKELAEAIFELNTPMGFQNTTKFFDLVSFENTTYGPFENCIILENPMHSNLLGPNRIIGSDFYWPI